MAYVSAQSARAKAGKVVATPTNLAGKTAVITPAKIPTVTPASSAVVPAPSVNIPGVNLDMSRLKPNARSVGSAYTVQESNNRAAVLKQRSDLIQTQRAQLNTEKQDLEKNHAAGLITDEEYQSHKLEHQNRDALLTKSAMQTGQLSDIAKSTATEQDRFLGGTIRALDPKTGKIQAVNPDGSSTSAPKTDVGVIEQSARDRLKKSGLSDEEINKRLSDPSYKQAIMETMSNTGQGGSFNSKTGKYIPPATLGNNPAAAAATKREQDKQSALDSTVIMKDVAQYDSEGNLTGVTKVVDQEATQAARDALATKQAAEDAHNADVKTHMDQNRAATTAEGDAKSVPLPSLENFISTLPPEQQDQARAYLQPVETFYDNMANSITDRTNTQITNETNDMAAIDDYQKKATAKNDFFTNMWKEMQDKALQGKLDAAQSQREMDSKELAYQQEKKDAQLNQAIRRQMVQNEKDRKDQLMGLGISGGWRSTRISADTIFALGRGEEIVSDLQTEKALSTDYFSTQSFKIEATYNSTVSQAYDSYEQTGFEGMQKFSAEADKIENTVYARTKDKTDAIKKLENDWFDFMAKNGESKLKMIRDGQDHMLKQVGDARDSQQKKEQQAWTNAMTYVEKYGTQDKAMLTRLEKDAGLLPGSLSNAKTIEELKMKRAGGVAGAGGPGGVAGQIDEQRKQIQQLYPNATGKQIDTLVYAASSKLFAKKDLLTAWNYMSQNPIGKELYRIQPMLTAKEGSIDVDSAQQVLEHQRALSTGEMTVDQMITQLKDAKDNGVPIFPTDDDIIRYMGDLGYTHTKQGGFLGFGQHDVYSPKK